MYSLLVATVITFDKPIAILFDFSFSDPFHEVKRKRDKKKEVLFCFSVNFHLAGYVLI